jgi:hypothetical protein
MESLTHVGLSRLLAEGALPALTCLYTRWYDALDLPDLPLLKHPHAERWTELSLGPLAPAALQHLPSCTRLQRLEMEWSHFQTPPPLALPRTLRHLDINAWADCDHLLTTLAAADGVERLRSLRLYLIGLGSGLTAADWQALGELLARLRGPVLYLRAGWETAPFLSPLTALPHLDRIAGLQYALQTLPDSELQALAKCPHLTGLRQLELQADDLKGPRAKWLAEAPCLERLRQLALPGVKMGYREVETLLRSPQLRRLTSLDLNCARLGPKGVRALEEWPGLSRLRTLRINLSRADRWSHCPALRLASLSPLTTLRVIGEASVEDKNVLRARHGARMWG